MDGDVCWFENFAGNGKNTPGEPKHCGNAKMKTWQTSGATVVPIWNLPRGHAHVFVDIDIIKRGSGVGVTTRGFKVTHSETPQPGDFGKLAGAKVLLAEKG